MLRIYNKIRFCEEKQDKKSASSHDEAALLGKKYHIDAKVSTIMELCKCFEQKILFMSIKKCENY